jgi:predicted dehydrogenase
VSDTANVGLIGCGHWGKNILRDLVSLGCRVHVVARSEASIGRAIEGGAASITSDISDLPTVDGYVVAVPTSMHADVLTEVLSDGAPVFVEKPMTADVESARRLAGEQHLFVMDKWRYHPGVEALRDLTASGRFAAPSLIVATRHSRFNPHHDVDAVWILAPHDLSIILEILGALPPAVSAVGESDGSEASLVGLMAGDGVAAVVDVSSRAHEFRREVRVLYESAVAVLSDGYAEAIEIHTTDPGFEPMKESIPIAGDMPLLLELEAFVGHLQGGPPPRSSAATGAAIVERIDDLRTMAGI